MAVLEAGDPDGLAVRTAAEQAKKFVALFVEPCPVDGPTYCGTYRLREPVAEGKYPVYVNKHGRVLYRNTANYMWVIVDGEKYTPELSAALDLPGSRKANSLNPTMSVPEGSNEWRWGSPPPASYHDMVDRGAVKRNEFGSVMTLAEAHEQLVRNDRTLTVTGLLDEDEVLRFETYAEEQLELEVEAGDVDASSVSAGGTESEARPPMSVHLYMPTDAGSSTKLKLVLRSGAGAQFDLSGDVTAENSAGRLVGIGDLSLSDIDIPPDRWDTTDDAVDGPILRCGENQLACYGWQEGQAKGRRKKGKWVRLWDNLESREVAP
jgi:hypothetical protein